MKVCPQCQASFAEGFVYCPRDAELLVRYDLRAYWRASAPDEIKFLLTPEAFGRRLLRELHAAWQDLRRDPRRYLTTLLRGEGSSRRRKQMLQAGVALAVIAYTLVVTALLLLGLSRSTTAEQLMVKGPAPEPPDSGPLKMVAIVSRAKNEFERGRNGHLGGSLPKPQRSHGGGSGGNQETLPASSGVMPRASLERQPKLPDFAPQLEKPLLPVTPTIVADPRTMVFIKGAFGLPEAQPAPPSKGPGEGGGIGNRHGTGVGLNGNGAGASPGDGFNMGGKKPGLGGGPTNGPGNQEGVRNATAYLRPTILFKEKAKYTEEAREQKIQGTVVLVATFNANGQISDIRVTRGLPSGLTEEAIQAAKRIRFQPAMENGKPVAVRTQLEYNFALY